MHSPAPFARRFTYLSLVVGLAGALGLAVGGCGSGGNRDNPELPQVVIDAIEEFVDVGQRFSLDASASTDPEGNSAELEFQWRIIEGGGIL